MPKIGVFQRSLLSFTFFKNLMFVFSNHGFSTSGTVFHIIPINDIFTNKSSLVESLTEVVGKRVLNNRVDWSEVLSAVTPVKGVREFLIDMISRTISLSTPGNLQTRGSVMARSKQETTLGVSGEYFKTSNNDRKCFQQLTEPGNSQPGTSHDVLINNRNINRMLVLKMCVSTTYICWNYQLLKRTRMPRVTKQRSNVFSSLRLLNHYF